MEPSRETVTLTAVDMAAALEALQPRVALALLDSVDGDVDVDVDVDVLRGRCLLRLGDVEEATSWVRRCLARQPDDADALSLWVSILRATGKQRSAVDVAQERVARLPWDLHGLLLLAAVQGEDRRWSDALATSETAVSLYPYSAEAHLQLARGLIAVGRRSEAREHYMSSMSLGTDAAVEYEYGVVLLEDRDFIEATERLAAVWSSYPHVPEVRHKLLQAAEGIQAPRRAFFPLVGALLGSQAWLALFSTGERSVLVAALGLVLPVGGALLPAWLVTAMHRRHAMSRQVADLVAHARREARAHAWSLAVRLGVWITAAAGVCLTLIAAAPVAVGAQPWAVFGPPIAIILCGVALEARRERAISTEASRNSVPAEAEVDCHCTDVDALVGDAARTYLNHLELERAWPAGVTQQRCPATRRVWAFAEDGEWVALAAVPSPESPVEDHSDLPGFYL